MQVNMTKHFFKAISFARFCSGQFDISEIDGWRNDDDDAGDDGDDEDY
jgi:hypothetical protein